MLLVLIQVSWAQNRPKSLILTRDLIRCKQDPKGIQRTATEVDSRRQLWVSVFRNYHSLRTFLVSNDAFDLPAHIENDGSQNQRKQQLRVVVKVQDEQMNKIGGNHCRQ